MSQQFCPEDCGCCKVPLDIECSPITEVVNESSFNNKIKQTNNKKIKSNSAQVKNYKKTKNLQELKEMSNSSSEENFPLEKIKSNSSQEKNYKKDLRPKKQQKLKEMSTSSSEENFPLEKIKHKSFKEKKCNKENTQSKKIHILKEFTSSSWEEDSDLEKKTKSSTPKVKKYAKGKDSQSTKQQKLKKTLTFSREESSDVEKIENNSPQVTQDKEGKNAPSEKQQKPKLIFSSSSEDDFVLEKSKLKRNSSKVKQHSKRKSTQLKRKQISREVSSASEDEEISDLNKVKSHFFKGEENILLKKCSIPLYDIGSQLHSDIININHIDLSVFANGLGEIRKTVDSSLSPKKKLADCKTKNEVTPIKEGHTAESIISDSIFTGSFKSLGSENEEEESLFEKLENSKKMESDLSDDSMRNKQIQDILRLLSDNSDDDQKHTESLKRSPKKKIQASTALEKLDKLPALSSGDEHDSLRKQKKTITHPSDVENCRQKGNIQLRNSPRKKIQASATNRKLDNLPVLSSDDDNDSSRKQEKKNLQTNSNKKQNSDTEEVSSHLLGVKNSGQEKIELKESSVLLHDIRSRLSPDCIEIHVIDAVHISDGHDKINNNVQSSLNKEKKLTNYTKEDKKASVKAKRSEEVVESDDNGSFKNLDSSDNEKQKESDKGSPRKMKLSSSARNRKSHKLPAFSSDESDVEMKLPKKLERREKRNSSTSLQSSDQEKIKTTTSKAIYDEETIQLKKCFVLLYNLELQNCSDNININDVNEALFSNGFNEKSLDSSLNIKRKSFQDCKSKERKLPLKKQTHAKCIESDSSSKDFLDFKKEKEKKSRKLKSKKQEKSDSSDDSVHPIKKKKKNSNVSIVSDKESDDEKEETLIKVQEKRMPTQKKLFPVKCEQGKNHKTKKEFRKREQVKYCESSSSDDDDDDDDDTLEKVKRRKPTSESRKESMELDNSYKKSLSDNESLDSENEGEKKSRKLKSKKLEKSDSSDDSVHPKKKKETKSNVSIISDIDSDDDEAKNPMKNKNKRTLPHKKVSSKEVEPHKSLQKRKEFRKKEQVQYRESSSSGDDSTLAKGKKPAARGLSRIESIESGSSYKESVNDNESLNSEDEVEKKSKKLISKKQVKSDSSDDSEGQKKKQSKSYISIISCNDSDVESEEKRPKRASTKKSPMKREARKGEPVKYCESSTSDDEIPLEKVKKLTARDESSKRTIESDSSFKKSLSDKESLDSESEAKNNSRNLKSKREVKSDSSDASSQPKIKQRKSNISIISDRDSDDEKKESVTNKQQRTKTQKRTSSIENESNKGRKRKKEIRKIEQVIICESSIFDDKSVSKKEKKPRAMRESHESNIESDSSSKTSQSDTESLERKKSRKSEKKVESDFSDDFILPKKKRERKTSNSASSDEDNYDEKKKEKRSERIQKEKDLRRKEVEVEYESKEGERRLRRRQQVKYFENSDSGEDNDSKKDKSKKDGSDDEDPDFDYDDFCEKSKNKKGESSVSARNNNKLSEYEKHMEEKKNKNLEFLKSLGIFEAKNDLLEATGRTKVKRVKKPIVRSDDPIIKRVSKRTKVQVDYDEHNLDTNQVKKSQSTETSFKEILNSSRLHETFVKNFSTIKGSDDFVLQIPVQYDKDVLLQLSQTASTSRIYKPSTMAWYPSTEKLVMAVGSFIGHFVLWNIQESFNDLHMFSIHSKKISNLKFSPYNPFHIFSSSLDGTFLLCDMQKQIFIEVLRISDQGFSYMDFFSPSSYLVSLTNGEVVIADKRMHHNNGQSDYQYKRYKCHDSAINMLNVHPVDKNYFVTAGKDEKVCIWDLRKLSHKPIVEKARHTRNVLSASFSPETGNFLLTSSCDKTTKKFTKHIDDCTACIFDCTNITEERVELHKSMPFKYNNFHVCKNPVSWLPNTDDMFACSMKDSSSKFHIFDRDLNIYETVNDGVGLRQHHTFHPFRTALASITCTKFAIST